MDNRGSAVYCNTAANQPTTAATDREIIAHQRVAAE